MLRTYFRRRGELAITDEDLLQLIRLFFTANKDRLGLSRDICRQQVERILRARKCQCERFRKHNCYLRNCWQTPRGLVKIIREFFCINCEGMSDALHHNALFQRWCSEFEEDAWFGAEGDFFQANLRGENIIVNPPFNNTQREPNILMKVIDRCLELARSEKPTRILLILPAFNGDNGDRYVQKVMSSGKASVVARFGPKNFYFDPPDKYYLKTNSRLLFEHSVFILLLCSQRSLVVDPIDWKGWKSRVTEWALSEELDIQFPCHPLDYFLPAKGETRAVRCETMCDPNLALMPWLNRQTTKLEINWPRDWDGQKRRAAIQLYKLPWAAGAAGVFPDTVRLLHTPDVIGGQQWLSRFSLSMLWSSFSLWKTRCEKTLQELRILSQPTCGSAYHSLQPVVWPNQWSCGCQTECGPLSAVPSTQSDRVPLANFLSGQQEVRKERKEKRKQENMQQTRRSERIRKRLE